MKKSRRSHTRKRSRVVSSSSGSSQTQLMIMGIIAAFVIFAAVLFMKSNKETLALQKAEYYENQERKKEREEREAKDRVLKAESDALAKKATGEVSAQKKATPAVTSSSKRATVKAGKKDPAPKVKKVSSRKEKAAASQKKMAEVMALYKKAPNAPATLEVMRAYMVDENVSDELRDLARAYFFQIKSAPTR